MKKILSVFLLLGIFAIGQIAHAKTELIQSPKEVVNKFCKLDSKGIRLSSKTYAQIKGLTSWEDEPGWDETVIIKKFKIINEAISGDTAEVKVTYQVIGIAKGDGVKKEPKKEEVTYKLQKISDQWKIQSPQLPPHVIK